MKNTFKIVLINGMYIIHKNEGNNPDIEVYSPLGNTSVRRLFVRGELFDKDGNGPLNDGRIDLYDHSILITFKVNKNAH